MTSRKEARGVTAPSLYNRNHLAMDKQEKEDFLMAIELVTSSLLATIERLEDLGMKQSASFGMVCGVHARLWNDMDDITAPDIELARDIYEFMQRAPGALKIRERLE